MADDKKEPTPPPFQSDDWRAIAEKASREQDPQKLTELVLDLCEKLDRRVLDSKRGKDEAH